MSSILRACMSNMLQRMRDKACDARLRRCRMPMAVSRAAFCLLTIVAMTGLWGWSFGPFAIVGWNVGLPVISWLSCADVAGLLMLALLAAWWLAVPVRRALFRFGMRLWKSGLLVVLPAFILLLRGSALWGSLFLLVGCALWLPLAVSLFPCDAGRACPGAGRGKDEAFEVPPHLPTRRSPLAACCVSLLVVSLYAAVLSSARVNVDGVVQWASPDLHVVAAWSAVCCWCAVAALAHICRVPHWRGALILPVFSACGSWMLGGAPLGASLASFGASLAFAAVACIWLFAMHRLSASADGQSAGASFLPVGVVLSTSLARSFGMQANEPATLLVFEISGMVLLIVQAVWMRSRAGMGGADGACVPSDRGQKDGGHSTPGQLLDCKAAEVRGACARLARHHDFTPREEAVVAAMAEGRSLAQIAQAEGITKSTAGTYAARAYVKLGVASRAETLEAVRREVAAGARRKVRARIEAGGAAFAEGRGTVHAAAGEGASHTAEDAASPALLHEIVTRLHGERVYAALSLMSWSLLAEALVLPWLGSAQSFWSLHGEAAPLIALLVMIAALTWAGVGNNRSNTASRGVCSGALGSASPVRSPRIKASGVTWLQVVAILVFAALAFAPGGLSWAAVHRIGRGTVSLVACISGFTAVALAFQALWNLWRDALPLRELVAVPMASSLAFGSAVCFDALVPVVLSCGIVCIAAIVVHACSCASVPASSMPGESVPHGEKPQTSPRAFSLRIGLVRGAALMVAGVACGMLFQLLNGSYLALHPWRLASSLAWHLVLHGTMLSAVLYVSMRAMRFAQRAGRSLLDVLSPIAMPWLLGFGCSSGVLVDALLQPHGSVRSVIALVAIGMVCGAWALASTIASYRRRLAFSRRTAGFLDQALEGSGLTDAECVVLGYLFRGFTAAGIARELTVSLNTARTHVRHVYAKLGVHGRSELFDAVERRLERYEERL